MSRPSSRAARRSRSIRDDVLPADDAGAGGGVPPAGGRGLRARHRPRGIARPRACPGEGGGVVLRASHADGEIYVAAYDDDGVWVGVLGYALQGFDDDPATEPALFVYDLEVFDAYRRRGHARDLLAHAESLARAAGAASVRLTVWEGNDGAHDLYRRVGFRDESHQMRLPLTDGSSR